MCHLSLGLSGHSLLTCSKASIGTNGGKAEKSSENSVDSTGGKSSKGESLKLVLLRVLPTESFDRFSCQALPL